MKILSTKESTFAKQFIFVSSSCESIWYVGCCSTWCFGNSWFVTAWAINFLFWLYTETATKKAAPYYDKWLTSWRVLTFLKCNLFPDARTSVFGFSVILFRDSNPFSFWNLVTWRHFLFLVLSFEKFTKHTQRNLINFLGKTEEKALSFCGKETGTLRG